MIVLRRKGSSSGLVPVSLLCWLFCIILLPPVFQSAPSPSCTTSSQTQGTGECNSTARISSSDYTHRIANLQRGASAVDVCLIVSAAQTLRFQRWLQIAVPQLERKLVSMGIGNETDKPNRYCLVQFGGRGALLRGHFLYVNGKEFFPSTSFVRARRELKRNGDVADGYEAVEFTLNNAPFRNDSTVKKVIFIVTNMGRSVLATKANLTKHMILNMLLENHVIFDTIVAANFSLQSSTTETVIGVTGFNTSSVIRPSGGYELIQGAVTLTSNEGQTVTDYVTLSLSAGSSSWSLGHLAKENTDVIQSFIRSFVAAHELERLRTVDVCQRCLCGDSGVAGGGSVESCENLVCDEHPDQQLCRCLVTRAPLECGVIDPTPVIPSVSSVSPMETPSPLLMEGSLDQFPGGEVEVSFDSDRSKANYQCVLLDQGEAPPTVIPCKSPHYLKNLSSGQYELLVIGKRKESIGSLRFKFTIEQDNLCDPQIHLTSVSAANNSVMVTFRGECFTVPDSEETVHFQCSTAGGEFAPCSSPFLIDSNDVTSSGVDFIVVAQDWRDRVYARIQHIEAPPPPTVAGPVMITNITIHPPDPFGRIIINFLTTDPSATCRCKVNRSIVQCPKTFTADPRVLGEGMLNITINCWDNNGYVDSKNLKLSLQMAPLPPSGPLSCQLNLQGPTEHGILIATYSCDRRVITTCQIAKMAPRSCDLPPSGQYEVDVSALEPGPHLFIINFDDGYGKSVMKICPFSIGTAHRKCCPQIASNSTVTAADNSANLSLSVMAGNCSIQEGFRYTVNWGDGASESGTSTTLSDVYTSRMYDTSESKDFVVEVSYCNNPVTEQSICCDSITSTVRL